MGDIIPLKAARSAQAQFARQAAAGLWWQANEAAAHGRHDIEARLLASRASLLDGARRNLGPAAAELANL